MPAMISHMLCGEKSITISACDQLRRIVKNNHSAFALGCQGPDPFMYYSILPWKKYPDPTRNVKYSDTIHFGLPTAFFKVLLENVKENRNETKIAYLAGFIAHHALDSTAHPYIYYETGSLKKKAGKIHQIFEKQLDYALLEQFGLKNVDFKAHKQLELTKEQYKEVSQLVELGLNQAFDAKAKAEEIKYAFISMRDVETIVFNPGFLKMSFIRAASRLVHMEELAMSMLTPTFYDEQLDVLNRRGETWYEPTDETIAHQENFMQIFDLACQKCANRYAALESYLEDKESLDSVLEVIGNGSYENGTVDKKMYFFKADQK